MAAAIVSAPAVPRPSPSTTRASKSSSLSVRRSCNVIPSCKSLSWASLLPLAAASMAWLNLPMASTAPCASPPFATTASRNPSNACVLMPAALAISVKALAAWKALVTNAPTAIPAMAFLRPAKALLVCPSLFCKFCSAWTPCAVLTPTE